MGLIDVLTQYDTKKKAAHAAKTVKHGVRNHAPIMHLCTYIYYYYYYCILSIEMNIICFQAGAEISTVHPEQYAKRFRDFISTIFA